MYRSLFHFWILLHFLYLGDTSKNIIPYFYEIIEKIDGYTLYEIWYKLNDDEREKIIKDIIKILKEFHSIKVKPNDFKSYIQELIIKSIKESNIKIDSIDKLISKCDIYFKENKYSLIHNDLHFDNFIYNQDTLKLIDFERCIIAPIDYDFKIFNRYNKEPWKWASFKTDMLTNETDYQNLMDLFISNYSELESIPYLKERLNIYLIIDYIKEYKHTRDDNLLNKITKMIEELI